MSLRRSSEPVRVYSPEVDPLGFRIWAGIARREMCGARIGRTMDGWIRSAGLRADAGTVDDDGVAALAQAAQERLGERRIGEEVRPGGIGQVRCNKCRLAMMPLFHELEEDVGLFRFDVDIPQLIDRQEVYARQ